MIKIIYTVIFISLCCPLMGQYDCNVDVKNLYNQGKYQETINLGKKEITKLNAKDSCYEKTLWLFADCHINLSDYKSAIEDYKILISLDSIKIEYYLGICYAYWSIDNIVNIDTALNYLLKAYRLDPKNAGTLNNMTYFFGQAGRFDESINFATLGLEQKNLQNTLKGALLNNRGYAYIGLKQYDKALIDINESIVCNPDNSFAYCYRAMANIGLKKMESVCPDLEKAKNLGGIILTKGLIDQYCK